MRENDIFSRTTMHIIDIKGLISVKTLDTLY